MSTDSDNTEASLPKIRTFAADLERERGESKPGKRTQPVASSDTDDLSQEAPEAPNEKGADIPKIIANEEHVQETGESAHTSNPPFHTISKRAKKEERKEPIKIDTSDFEEVHKEKAPSVLESAQDRNKVIIDEEDETSGTIVSDVKRKRFRFFPSLFASIRQSLIEFGELFTTSNKRTYSIPDSSHRKGVIQTATSKTGRFATGDHDQVVSRIKQKRKTVVKAEEDNAPEAKPKTSEDTDSTQPITDPAHLLEDPDVEEPTKAEVLLTTEKDKERKISKVEAEPRRSVTAQKAVIPAITPVVPQTPVPTEPPVPVAPPVTETSADSFVKQPVVGVGANSGAFNNQVAIDEERGPASDQPADPITANTEPSEEDRTFSETNILAVGTVVAILIILTSFLLIRAVLEEIDFRSAPTERYEPHVFLEDAVIQTITLDRISRSTLINAVAPLNTVDTTNTTQINPVTVMDGLRRDIDPDVLMPLMFQNADSAFSGAIAHISFGVRSSDRTFIMLEAANTESARGGLLQWETTMPTDLAPLLGISASSSDASTGLSPFTDDTINTIDVRVYDGPVGDIYYGFVDARTILITTDQTDFATIADMLKE